MDSVKGKSGSQKENWGAVTEEGELDLGKHEAGSTKDFSPQKFCPSLLSFCSSPFLSPLPTLGGAWDSRGQGSMPLVCGTLTSSQQSQPAAWPPLGGHQMGKRGVCYDHRTPRAEIRSPTLLPKYPEQGELNSALGRAT